MRPVSKSRSSPHCCVLASCCSDARQDGGEAQALVAYTCTHAHVHTCTHACACTHMHTCTLMDPCGFTYSSG